MDWQQIFADYDYNKKYDMINNEVFEGGCTKLMYFIINEKKFGGFEAIKPYLLQNIGDINLTNEDGNNALQNAIILTKSVCSMEVNFY